MLRTLICFALVLAGSANSAWAEDAKPSGTESQLGVVAGTITGVGLKFGQLNVESGWGWQVAGIPYWGEKNRFLNFGAKVNKVFHTTKDWRLFGSLGAAIFYTRDGALDPEDEDDRIRSMSMVAVGPSVGVEYRVEHFGASLEMPAAALIPISGGKAFEIAPFPCAQLYYRW